MKKRAILSVFDKTGIVELAAFLDANGYEIVSTGGTARALAEQGIKTVDISDITGFPECLDGRVKTLHPKVHAGILAMRSNSEHMATLSEFAIAPVDIVVINLYPFKATIEKPNVTLAEAIENIDIGGPSMLRAAAKNWQDVAVVVDPADYSLLMTQIAAGGIDEAAHFRLAAKVFEHTAYYDALIAEYLRSKAEIGYPKYLTLPFDKVQDLRYGENPHQSAVFYKEPLSFGASIAGAKVLGGKELSFNNINDAAAALDILAEYGDTPAAVAVKHANPCGVGLGDSIYTAYSNAYSADPVSIFGGIVALNKQVDAATAKRMNELFLEVVLAPSYEAEALEILQSKKNLRILQIDALDASKAALDLKKVTGGLLIQDKDTQLYTPEELVVVTEKAPTEQEMADLLFAWRVVKHTKSNGIVLAKNSMTVGIGPGQTNRITALDLAVRYADERVAGSVLASDAFFPFGDCVELAKKSGITAIIQPGGSIRDQESIDLCNKYGISMVFTKMRHFKH